jgi:hypothetical protein
MMALLAKLAKSKGLDLAEFLQPQEVAALETALTDPKKHAAARVMVKNLEKQMDVAKAKKLKALLNENWHAGF